ncbi:hypothetical protein [Pontibacter harenae]|uniref:hypothetical protein n=1 Tax=Pontibacter harenae TaxID=2894083 RepID=UPI001E53BF62|nr:hypothetical protein [Pontibacter harenae]MCC9167727.1 hypothetical protein [Pontibacter harenae]
MHIKGLYLHSFCLLVLWLVSFQTIAFQTSSATDAHVWEMQEITLKAENTYANY